MEHLFIINPAAGKTDRSRELCEIISHIKTADKVTVRLTRYCGEATEIVKNYLSKAEAFTRIYACGGDGTANEALKGAVGFENCAIGVIPIGTGNDLIRSFKGICKDDFLDVEKMMHAPLKKIDVLECGGRYSVNVLSVGFDCAVAKNVDKFKKLSFVPAGLAYKMSIFYCLFSKRKHSLKISVDGKLFSEADKSTLLAAAGNGCYYGGGIKATPNARLDDGKIDFMHIPTVSVLKFVSLLSTYIKGKHVDNPRLPFVTDLKCERVDFEAPEDIDVNFEGEIVPMKNPSIRILPGKVSFIVPESEQDRKELDPTGSEALKI